MLQAEFVDHLARKGVLRDGQAAHGGLAARSGDLDWMALTTLPQSAFADELAAFYRCPRVQRQDLVGHKFAGGRLSARFLREARIFPFEDGSGKLTVAIAAPVDNETARAVEIALRRSAALAVATADDIDAALATTLENEPSRAPAAAAQAVAADAAISEDNLDDLRDLARGAPVVRALDDLLRLAADQRATDLHIEPFAGA